MVDAIAASSGPTENDIAALTPGRRIGRYEIVSVLGQGGFGVTYRARDGQLDREVAIKEYLPTQLAWRADGVAVLPRSTKVAAEFSAGRERFIAEGRTLASLHEAPAIVKVFDYLEANGTACIVMELLRGRTLEAEVADRGPMGAPAFERLLWPLLDGLERVHAAGFLHRDITPANILLNAEGLPTLIDFGAARATVPGRSSTMTAIFTPGFAAPEQFTAAPLRAPADIYGLAATLYFALTGKPPANAVDRMLDDTCQPLAELRPAGISEAILVGLDAGLALRADDRPQSIAEWRAILAQASGELARARVVPPTPVGGQATTRVMRLPPRSRRPWMWRWGRRIGITLAVLGGIVWGLDVALQWMWRFVETEFNKPGHSELMKQAAEMAARYEEEQKRYEEERRRQEEQRRLATIAKFDIDRTVTRWERTAEGTYRAYGEIVNKGGVAGTPRSLKLAHKKGNEIVAQKTYGLALPPIAGGGRAPFSIAIDRPPEGITDTIATIE